MLTSAPWSTIFPLRGVVNLGAISLLRRVGESGMATADCPLGALDWMKLKDFCCTLGLLISLLLCSSS